MRNHKNFTIHEKKCLRADFSNYIEKLKIPPLLNVQLESYEKFLQKNIDNTEIRKNIGLEKVFKSIFPIVSNNKNIILKYIRYNIKDSIFNTLECKKKGLTYSGQFKIKISLINKNEDQTKNNTQEIYILDLPLMTETGSFIINGTERVVVSQLHRSPGIFFEVDKSKSHLNEKTSYTAKIIPNKGAWLDIELDAKNLLSIKIDKKRKISADIVLKALGLSNEEIINNFFEEEIIEINNDEFILKTNSNNLLNNELAISLKHNNEVIIEKNTKINEEHIKHLKHLKLDKFNLSYEDIENKIITKDIYNKNNELVINAGTIINYDIINIIKKNDIKKINIIYSDKYNYQTSLLNTINSNNIKTQIEALTEIYKILRPGEPQNKDSAKLLFDNLFSNSEKYDLSQTGRMKINKRLNKEDNINKTIICKNDIISIIKKIIDIKHEKDKIDDIDSLSNRRVRSVGEMLENQFRNGFARIEKSIKEKLSLAEYENLTPQDIINAKPIAALIREFFCSSQLSQFMDQTNPLAEITHKRRISSLGPGGLTRERAGFEVRDVHTSHYGRICPIETPEGPNIGLINSLAIYSKINEFGFIETPYIKVENKKVTDIIEYHSSIEEDRYIIAQANEKINEKTNELISCRHNNEFKLINSEYIQYMDISPKQIVSVAAALIPFLEHDDANRALMGSNMQRQAVPLLKTEKPLVGTGIEKIVAKDSIVTVLAKNSGTVDKVDSSRIIIKTNNNNIESINNSINIYNLIKFTKSNHNTCINQKPIIKTGEIIEKGEIIADGQATDLGELALGKNLLTAFMSWYGYNFEDSIIISEDVVKKNKFLSIHIEELICIARDLKLGAEEITIDIPNINENYLSKLDESGIIYIGAEVKPGDIIVGKVTPKGELQLTAEEKLLQAIFGEKASDVKDTSLRIPSGISGKVIDVQIFTREGIKKDKRTLEIEHETFNKIKKNINDELRILKDNIKKHIMNIFDVEKKELKKNINLEEILEIKTENENINNTIKNCNKIFTRTINEYNLKLKIKENKIKQGDDLPPGILKIVKIFIAMKKQIQPGDKISGRHGNKGVVSIIVPTEDMPYLENGNPIELILNPLSIPSRMNVGQVLETHLGWASGKLGEILNTIKNIAEKKTFLSNIYNIKKQNINFLDFNEDEIKILSENLKTGIPMSTPIFNGINENDIKNLLKIAKLPTDGKTILYDGKTGDVFDERITVGLKYIMKLNHLIDDKLHARSTGSYSLVSQQPLGGKAQFGGQRFGEMEVWALEAYGAAYTLQEMLTIKSDDISGRTKIYKNIIDNNYQMEAGIPESFNVLLKEILSLGLNIELESD